MPSSWPRTPFSFVLLLLVSLFLALTQPAIAQDSKTCQIPGTTEIGVVGQAKDPLSGKPVCLPINRQPALYTGAFGDCLGSSQMEITRFSAAYFKDNMTLSFELEGHTNLTGGAIMMYVVVYAYGENRYQYLWDPCGSAAQNICPLNSSHPFYSTTVIPLGQDDIQNIPDIALSIPDFEGQAVMRIFSNQTQNEIACYSAAITNGITFSQPGGVGTVVGLFVMVAVAASFLSAAYGLDVPEMRLHYAHSMSVWVVFAVLQHIFFTGALSVNWPAVLPAFWSNFAWAAGMIHSSSMQENLSSFAGNQYGNTTFVGAAETGSSSDGTGGGWSKSQIYKRAADTLFRAPATLKEAVRAVEEHGHVRKGSNFLMKRDDSGDVDFNWFGKPVTPGLPLPGNYSGFAGTLSLEDIAASNAFMTGFVWFIILLVIVIATSVGLKWLLEGYSRLGWMKQNRLTIFRGNYLQYTVQLVLRACFIAFFMFMFLAMFQFSYHGAPGPVAIASLVFLFFLIGSFYLCYLVLLERAKRGCFVQRSDRIHFRLIGALPIVDIYLESSRSKEVPSLFSIPWIVIEYSSSDPERYNVHQDEDFVRRFGWLTSRFRADQWWFFAFWLAYDFLRACFLGGAAGHPQTQVFALLAIEFIAFFLMIKIKPFEGNRINTLMVWLLGLSKIITTALSSAFDPAFNLGRILTTALGIIIIVVQTLLLLAMMILIAIGAASTYMSVMRNRNEFFPEHWRPAKNAYFRHLAGLPREKKRRSYAEEEPIDFFQDGSDPDRKPYFKVDSIRRMPKVYEMGDSEAQGVDPYGSRISLHNNASQISAATPLPLPPARPDRRSRTYSMQSGNLPFGARASRAASWSSHDVIWSASDSRPSSSHRNEAGSTLPRMPEMPLPAAFRSRENLVDENIDAGGYQIMPARGRASTMRSVSSPVRTESGLAGSNRSSGAEIPLELLKPRSRISTASEASSLTPGLVNKMRGPSPLGIAPVTATRDDVDSASKERPMNSPIANFSRPVSINAELANESKSAKIATTTLEIGGHGLPGGTSPTAA